MGAQEFDDGDELITVALIPQFEVQQVPHTKLTVEDMVLGVNARSKIVRQPGSNLVPCVSRETHTHTRPVPLKIWVDSWKRARHGY